MPRPYGRRVRRPDERPLRALIAGVTAGTSTRVPSSPFASGVACCTNTPATRRTRTARRRSISIRPSERGHAEATIGPRIISQSLLRRHWRLRCEAHTDDVTRSLLTTGLGADWFRVFLSKGGRAGIGRPVFQGGPGGWELVGRVSYIDLDSGALQGGRFWRLTPMVNWYLSDHVRLEMTYGYGTLDRFELRGKTHFFQTRLQLQM